MGAHLAGSQPRSARGPRLLSVGSHKGHRLENIIMGYSEMAREEQRLHSSALPTELSEAAQEQRLLTGLCAAESLA